MKPKIAIIVARDRNKVIGCSEGLPWHIPDELKYFKNITMNKPVIMGRKTYEFLGKPLKGRVNIVLTRSNFSSEGIIVKRNIKDAIETGIKEALISRSDEVMVIGGSEIFSQSLRFADKIYLTEINSDFNERPTAFLHEQFEKNGWSLVSKERKTLHETRKESSVDCEFLVLEKKKNIVNSIINTLIHQLRTRRCNYNCRKHA